MVKVVVNIVRYASWVHEIFHFIPAKLLGMKIKLRPDHVIFDLADQEWKNFVVMLGPFVVFGLLFVGVAASPQIDRGWLWPAGFLWASCIWDVTDVIRFVRTGEWEK